jgi:hypothetical protein
VQPCAMSSDASLRSAGQERLVFAIQRVLP